MAKETLTLYSTNCKKCRHLDPDEQIEYDCTADKGNSHCPASEVQIVVTGNALRLAHRAFRARKKKNVKMEAKILADVAQTPRAFQLRFYQCLESLCHEHQSKQ